MDNSLPRFKAGDHVKVEFRAEGTPEAEIMWVEVDYSDDERQLIFGRLDNQPIVDTVRHLRQKLAVSYDSVREHRRFR